MKESRHPHPHIDPRQPRDGSQPDTNPPVFAWKPREGDANSRLTIARDASLAEVCVDLQGLSEPVYLPEKAFAPGKYYWEWSAGGEASETFSFEITPAANLLEVPPVEEWLRRFPSRHPRFYVQPEDADRIGKRLSEEQPELMAELRAAADQILGEPHEIEEPPYLPDRHASYADWIKSFSQTMWSSRQFVAGAEALALAYLLGSGEQYARAACSRLASICKWDPEGSSHLAHNDEAHMSVIWWGPTACDWVWDQFTEDERVCVLEHFRRRGQITYEHMHGRGSYGVQRFDSHAGREVVFLAMIALGFHEDLPESRTWLEWLRPVLCGIWPIWAGPDGGWAEGVSYGLAYVNIMTRFATALKAGAGIDLYTRPFWKGHAKWRQWCFPAYAEWIGFGDHSERWKRSWLANADLVELIGRQTGTAEFADYVADFRREAETCEQPPDRGLSATNPQRYLLPGVDAEAGERDQEQMLAVFAGAGWAAIRTAIQDPARDTAFIFRSSPFGSISHSHANNNDFILHVAGKVMAMPSGYYNGYGSSHHAQWVWHTKSHNCITLSGAPQLLRSHDSRGAVEHAYEDSRLVYFCGNADASYRDRAKRCRRHVVFLKRHQCFVLVDEFEALPGAPSAVEWNIHSWNEFSVDEQERSFLLERDGSSLRGHFLFHHNSFFTCTEGWEPPPHSDTPRKQWRQQYHLRFTPSGLCSRLNLGVVLCPGHAQLPLARVETSREGDAEAARIGEDLVLVNQSGTMEHGELRSESLALLIVEGSVYEVAAEGIGLRSM